MDFCCLFVLLNWLTDQPVNQPSRQTFSYNKQQKTDEHNIIKPTTRTTTEKNNNRQIFRKKETFPAVDHVVAVVSCVGWLIKAECLFVGFVVVVVCLDRFRPYFAYLVERWLCFVPFFVVPLTSNFGLCYFFFCSVVVVVFVFINHPMCCLSICPQSVLPSICPSYYGWMLLVLILLPLVASSHKKVKKC